MKRSTIVVAGVLALALVGGGTAFALTSADQEPLSAEAPETSAPAPTEGSSTDATSAPEASAPVEASPEDAEFLAVVRGELLPDTGIADVSDEMLIEAGHEACEVVKAGTPPEDIRLVEGEEPARSGYYMDTSAILFGAQTVLCPETINPPS